MKDASRPKMKIAFAGAWKTIHPGLQHTLVGDLTLSNQFESLAGLTGVGIYVPLAARSWTVSADYKVFQFKIDTSRKFSDGTPLSARHFKESWENSFRLEAKSSNSSLLDVLYKLDGFSDFEKLNGFSGIRVIDDETLEIRFSTPFRMALEHLSGNRFSAYIERQGKFLGTGPFVITEIDSKRLLLEPNPHFKMPPTAPIELSSIVADEAIPLLESGELDAVAYLMASNLSEENLRTKTNLTSVIGQDALHRAIYLNSQPGSLFSNTQFRRAFQYLAYETLKNHRDRLGSADFTSFDMQVYLPLQSGRLEAEEVQAIIEEGASFVDELRDATNERPLVLIETADNSIRWLLEMMNLRISPDSRVVSKPEIIDLIYKGHEGDVIPGTFGIASGDPDGIYHKLGKSGAIASPMTNNDQVSQLLEQGRTLVEKKDLDKFYRNVSREILREAPLVHLGFSRAIAIYRNDKLTYNSELLRRNEGGLEIFKTK